MGGLALNTLWFLAGFQILKIYSAESRATMVSIRIIKERKNSIWTLFPREEIIVVHPASIFSAQVPKLSALVKNVLLTFIQISQNPSRFMHINTSFLSTDFGASLSFVSLYKLESSPRSAVKFLCSGWLN